jgi:uncharacterized protein (TIGR03086 family)
MEPIDQLDAVVPTLGDLVRRVRPDQLDNPTPCAEFSVRDLMAHFVGNVDTLVDAFQGKPITDLPLRPGILGDDPGRAYDEVLGRFRTVIREPGAMDRVISMPPPFGDVPAPVLIRFVAFDFVVHSWDLATATGQQYTPPDELVGDAEAFARQAVSSEMRVPGVIGPEVEAPPGASALECLVAFAGRKP